MICLVRDGSRAAGLFDGWQETMIWSCMQGIMGRIYGDHETNPTTAMAILGDFCFFAGKPNEGMALYKPDWCGQEFIIMVPQSQGWADVIESVYGAKSTKVVRYAMKKEPEVFDAAYLGGIVGAVPQGIHLQMIGQELFEKCLCQPWSADLVSQYGSYQEYRRIGLGVAAVKGGEVVSGASSYASYRNGIEIEIDTREDHRREGLALCCGAKLILECLERGLYPSWDAQNKASVALAEKLGYHFDHEYAAYEIRGY